MRGLLIAAIALFCSFNAMSQSKTFGAWYAGLSSDKESVYAATVNDSNVVFGQWCYFSTNTCYWLMVSDSTCDDGDDYPSIVNSVNGASYVSMRCLKIDNKNKVIFNNFKLMESLTKGDGKIGIVTPMQSGNFKVSRFDLNGAASAIDTMNKMYEVISKSKPSTKDVML